VSGEAERLATLETALMGAAATQASRRRRRRRRGVVLAAVVAPLVLAAAGSVAGMGVLRGVDHNLSTLRDDRLSAPPRAVAGIEASLGARSRDGESTREWYVGPQRVVGYTTPAGRFCYTFVARAGGCLSRAALTPGRPLNLNVDSHVSPIRLYGLASDDVIAVTVVDRGVTRSAALAHNAFYFQFAAAGGRRGFALTIVAHMRGGATRRMRVPIGEPAAKPSKTLPALPGALPPVETTAA
jgi:hypothetical protein